METSNSLRSQALAWLDSRKSVTLAHAQAALNRRESERLESLGLPAPQSLVTHWQFDPEMTDPTFLDEPLKSAVIALLAQPT